MSQRNVVLTPEEVQSLLAYIAATQSENGGQIPPEIADLSEKIQERANDSE